MLNQYEIFARKLSEKSGIPINVNQVTVWEEGHCPSMSNKQQIASIEQVDRAIKKILPNHLDILRENKLLVQVMIELDLVD